MAYSSPSYCNSDSTVYPIILTGIGGPNTTFSSTPIGLHICFRSYLGAITPSLATPGTYVNNVCSCPRRMSSLYN